jgi:hypothetical protein
MLDKQFWPRVSYGLCAVSAWYQELSECLMKTYYRIHPQGGVRRIARRGIHQLDRGFYGIGCPHPAIECLLAQLNKLMMHYGCQTCLGLELQTSMELLVIKIGLSAQPFQENYGQHHQRVTHLWMKLVWEKAHRLKVTITLADLPSQLPRERDSWLMKELDQLDYSDKELQRLNRVRLHQQVLYLSDVMDASGRALDQKYLHPRPRGEAWSTLVFPLERLAPRNFRLWREALPQIRALGGRLHLGRYTRPGHKVWELRYNLESSKLYRCRGELVDILEPSQFIGVRTRANRYSRTCIDQATTPQGGPCTVEEAGLGIYKVISYTDMPPPLARPETIWEVLQEWGYT